MRTRNIFNVVQRYFSQKHRDYINQKNRKRLKNSNFSVLANNCNGAFILNELGQRFNSPFVNLWLYPKDFIKYLKNMDYYNELPLGFIHNDEVAYPIGVLGDIKIYFQHYHSEEEAKRKWEERKQRINKNNLFVLLTERDGCTYEDLKEFDNLPLKNKMALTHIPYTEIKNSYYIKGFENNGKLGDLYPLKNKWGGRNFMTILTM